MCVHVCAVLFTFHVVGEEERETVDERVETELTGDKRNQKG